MSAVKMLAPVALLAVSAVLIVPYGHQNKPGERYVVFEQSGVQLVLDMVTAKSTPAILAGVLKLKKRKRNERTES